MGTKVSALHGGEGGCRGVQLGQPCVQPSKTIEKYRHRGKKKKENLTFCSTSTTISADDTNERVTR